MEVDVHHIIPWETCKKHEYENLIALCPNCHRRLHNGAIDRKSLRAYKARLRFEHERFANYEIDILFQSAKMPPGRALTWPPHAEMLLFRIIDAGLITLQPAGGGGTVRIAGLNAVPWFINLTDKGREFVASFNAPEFDD